MKQQSVVFLLLVLASSLKADYKWTGKEWVWEEDSKDKLSPAVDEGSAEYDYDGAYDYKDEKDAAGPAGNIGGDVSISSNLPTDDEDFGGPDGSGDDGYDPFYDDRLDGEGGSGDYAETPTRRVTTTTQSPTIDLDSPFGGFDSGARPREPSVTFDNRNKQDSSSVYNPFDTKGASSTESPAIDLDNRGPPLDFGPKEPVQPFDYDPTSYDDDYPDGYDDNYDDYENPPYDDIPIDEVSSTTTTTTTTSTTPKPYNRDTPIIQDIPTNRPASFFAQPGILAAVIGGAVVGLLCAILLVMFIVYRMRKKDEGSYILDEPTRTHNGNLYSKTPNKEFYA